MFTGLIEEIGTIASVERGGVQLAVEAARVTEGLGPGDSIAVSGPCLTVERVQGGRFWASLLPETAGQTTLGRARPGQRVNLERPLRLGDRLGGHLVTGHVDGVAEVASVEPRGETRLVSLLCPAWLERYLVDQGSVALDGVSLTVRRPSGGSFSVSLVGATMEATTLGDLRRGSLVNVEVDILAKHVARLLEARSAPDASDRLLSWLGETELT